MYYKIKTKKNYSKKKTTILFDNGQSILQSSNHLEN